MFSLSLTYATHNPALLVLREKGYELAIIPDKNGGASTFVATAPGRRFSANGGAELLGLVTTREHFGEDWNRQVPDVMDDAWKEGPHE
jgi:hypothetical protein